MDLQLSRRERLRSWAGTPNQLLRRYPEPASRAVPRTTTGQTYRLYRRMRIGAAQREISRSNGGRLLALGYGCLSHADRLCRYRNIVLPNGAHVWYKGNDGLW